MNTLIWFRRAALALIASLVFIGGASAAHAVTLKVSVVHAQKKNAQKDPALKRIQGRLERAFSRYSSFKRLAHHEFRLSPGKKASAKLPGTKAKTANFHYVGPVGKGAHKVGLKIGENEFNLRIPEKRLFFQAGLKHGDGMLILAIYLRN